MVAIKAHFDGKVFVPDEPVDLAAGQRVHIVPAPADAGTATATARRLATDAPWAGRTDINDSSEYARELRRQAESRGNPGGEARG